MKPFEVTQNKKSHSKDLFFLKSYFYDTSIEEGIVA